MNFRDITDKLKDTIIPRDVKKEDFELTEMEKKEIIEEDNMEDIQKPISDEVETTIEEPMRIKTVFVKSSEQETEEDKKYKMRSAVKIAAGVTLVAAAGLTAILLNSKKRRW